tara:strand:- start:43 stop:4128 length:4086 start_codon:yes stop_codon:yes gene_type:complete
MRLSKGDIVVNKAVALGTNNTQELPENNPFAKLESSEIEKRKEKFWKTTEDEAEKEKLKSDIKSIIALDKSAVVEGGDEYKYTFDNIYEDEQLAEVAKDYYTEKDGKAYTSKEAIDKFIRDRTWKQANTASIVKEFSYITGSDVSQDQKARLAYLTQTWSALPNFYEEGGRGLSGFAANLGVALLDPLNIISGGIGGLVGKATVGTAAKQALKSATKTATGKAIAKETTKDIILNPEQLAKLSSSTANKRILKTAGTISAIDGVGFALADIAAQTTEKEVGLREKLDPYRTMLVSIGAAGTSFIATAGIGYGVSKLRNVRADTAAKNAPSGLNKIIENNAKLTDEGLKKFSTRSSKLRANLADQYDFVKVLQKELLGVEGSAAGLRAADESGKFVVDPVLMPYFQLRMAAAASTRAHEFIAKGVHMPPGAMMGKASFIKGRSMGLHDILKPFDKVSQVAEFLAYIAAKRQRALIKNNPKLKNELPNTTAEINKMIDYGEMTPAQYSKKYGETLTRKTDFQDGAANLKVFTDELLEYQVRSGLLSEEDASKILKANEFFIPLYRQIKPTKITKAISKQMEKILRTARPGAKQLAKTKQEGDINLYDNLITYVYKAINGADRNRAKIALYEMINKAKKLKQLDSNALIKKTNYAVENKKAIGAVIKKRYEDAGFKIIGDSEGKLPNLDIAVFGSTFKKLDQTNFVDIVYVNGKQTAYEILNKDLHEAFVSFGDDTMRTLNKGLEAFGISKYSRVASRAITYSPPFVAFNAIRDTLAGTVNSVFGMVNRNGVGFVPGFTSVKAFIKSFILNDTYRKAMIAGMGYSSRADSERLLNLSSRELIKFGTKAESRLYTGSLKKLYKMLGGGWRGWKEFVSRVEYATRMGEYELARKAGLSEVASGFLGREVSTDFGMRGSSVKLKSLSRNTMFLNAGLQGLYRTGRLAFEGTVKDRARVASTIAATIIAPEMYLYFKNRDIPQYQRLDERIKQLNYVIPTYENINGKEVFDGFIFIPKPYDLGVFANISVALVKGIGEKTPELGLRYALQSIGNIIPAIPIPTAFVPAAELIFNRNFYTGGTVLGMYERQLVDTLQYRPQTREIAKILANFLSNMRGVFKINEPVGAEKDYVLSPLHIDYLIGAYATGILQYPFDMVNDIFFETADKGSALEKIDPFGYKKKGLDIVKPKASVTSRKFNIKKPWTIVTSRFQSENVIKNSFFHKEWYRIQQRAKELGVMDLTNLDTAQDINVQLMKIFDNIQTNLDNNNPLISEEVQDYMQLGGVVKEYFAQVATFRKKRKAIEILPNLSSEKKREQINSILAAENIMLHEMFKAIAKMDLEHVLSDTMRASLLPVSIDLETYGERKK